MWNLSAYRLTGVFRKSLWLINLLSVVYGTGLAVEVALAWRWKWHLLSGGSGPGFAANAAVALVAGGLHRSMAVGPIGTAARRSRPGGWRYPAAAAVGCWGYPPRRRRPPALGAEKNGDDRLP